MKVLLLVIMTFAFADMASARVVTTSKSILRIFYKNMESAQKTFDELSTIRKAKGSDFTAEEIKKLKEAEDRLHLRVDEYRNALRNYAIDGSKAKDQIPGKADDIDAFLEREAINARAQRGLQNGSMPAQAATQ